MHETSNNRLINIVNFGEHLSDKVKQKMTTLKTNHPELGALADRMLTMNVTEVTNELAALLEFGQTTMGAVRTCRVT